MLAVAFAMNTLVSSSSIRSLQASPKFWLTIDCWISHKGWSDVSLDL